MNERIERFSSYFYRQLEIVDALALEAGRVEDESAGGQSIRFYRKVLLVNCIDTLAGIRFSKERYPELNRRNRERFIKFLIDGEIWPSGELVGIPFLSEQLENGDLPGSNLKRHVYSLLENINSTLEWSVNFKDLDQPIVELRKLVAVPAEEEALVENQHYSILYRYRNYLIHESRVPGKGIEIGADEEPHYHSYLNDERLFLVYPYPMFMLMARRSIDYVKRYFTEHCLDPYDYVTRDRSMVGEYQVEIDRFNRRFERLCAQLKGLDRTSLLAMCIQKLREIDRRDNLLLEPAHIWEVLLLLKWGFVFCPERKADESIPVDQFAVLYEGLFLELLELVVEMVRSGPIAFRGEPCSPYKMLRLMCYQQFWLQIPVSFDRVVRPLVMMCGLGDELGSATVIEDLFRREEGIELMDFFELTFILHMRRKQIRKGDGEFLTAGYFSNLERGYSPEVIDRFLSIISVTEEAAVAIARRSFEQNPPHLQISEQTPFVQAPLIAYDPKPYEGKAQPRVYYEIGPILLDELVRNYPFVKLKSALNEEQQFSRTLGGLFEAYLKKGIQHWGVDFSEEEEIVSNLRESRSKSFKPVDFLVSIKDLCLLIEAKSNLPHGEAKVNLQSEVLIKRFDNDLIRSFKKIYSTASRLTATERGKMPFGAHKERELVAWIVTYDELYLWDGKVAWEEFVGEAVMPYLNTEGIDKGVISPENILIISVSSFDKMMELLARRRVTVSQLMRKARKQRKKLFKKSVEGATRLSSSSISVPMGAMSFENHLDDFAPDLRNLLFLKQGWLRMQNSIMKRLGEQSL